MPNCGDDRAIAPASVQGVAHRNAWERGLQRAFDLILSLPGLVLLAPLLAAIALAVKLGDGGPVLYCQYRVGKDLKRFRLLKFRSMHRGAANGGLLTAPQDARVTRVGRFLRRYKLDELPQLVNVLKGDMRLVGVRPQVDRYVEMFRKEYEELLQAPPGVTGLSTLKFRHEDEFFREGSIEAQYVERILPRKLQLALEYERSRNFLSDLEILFRTVLSLAPRSTKSSTEARHRAFPALQKVVTKDSD